MGQGRAPGRPGAERRAQRRLVHQPADVPGTDRSGSRLRHLQSPRVGQGAEVMAVPRHRRGHGQARRAPCLGVRCQSPVPAGRHLQPGSTAAGRRGLEARDGQDEYRSGRARRRGEARRLLLLHAARRAPAARRARDPKRGEAHRIREAGGDDAARRGSRSNRRSTARASRRSSATSTGTASTTRE